MGVARDKTMKRTPLFANSRSAPATVGRGEIAVIEILCSYLFDTIFSGYVLMIDNPGKVVEQCQLLQNLSTLTRHGLANLVPHENSWQAITRVC